MMGAAPSGMEFICGKSGKSGTSGKGSKRSFNADKNG